MASAVMSPTEQLMLKAIENEFYSNVDSMLLMLGYVGSFRDPYDEHKNAARKDYERDLVIYVFEERPRPVSVGFRPAGDYGCRVYIDADRSLNKANADWLVDFCSDPFNRVKNLISLVTLSRERSVTVPLKDVFEPVDALRAFGIDTTYTGLSNSFEDIEVDIENPLGLDFPDIKDDD